MVSLLCVLRLIFFIRFKSRKGSMVCQILLLATMYLHHGTLQLGWRSLWENAYLHIFEFWVLYFIVHSNNFHTINDFLFVFFYIYYRQYIMLNIYELVIWASYVGANCFYNGVKFRGKMSFSYLFYCDSNLSRIAKKKLISWFW